MLIFLAAPTDFDGRLWQSGQAAELRLSSLVTPYPPVAGRWRRPADTAAAAVSSYCHMAAC